MFQCIYFRHFIYNSIYTCIWEKSWKEMYLGGDFQINLAPEELTTLAAILSWFYSCILIDNRGIMVQYFDNAEIILSARNVLIF